MFNSNILDVAIGMIFIYLLLSLMCSAANEIIELMLKKRAIDLERGIRELLAPGSESGTADIVQKLYDHALVNNLFGGTYDESRIKSPLRRILRTQLPSYIPARNFALALMDLVGSVPAPPQGAAPAAAPPPPPPTEPASGATGATMTPRAPGAAQFVLNVPPPAGAAPHPPAVPPAVPPAAPPPPGAVDNPLTPLREAITTNPLLPEVSRRSLITLLDAAGNDVVKARENIENWYNSSMDRVSGWYKRRTQLTILVIAFFVAITVNVDTITVAKRLSTDKAMRESLVAAADAYSKANAQPSESPTPTPESDANATPTPTPESRANATPTPTPESKANATATPTPSLPECDKDPNSAECKRAKLAEACVDPDSDGCQREKVVQAACQDPASDECKTAMLLQRVCKDPDSFECRRVEACTDPDSSACQRARAVEKACADADSPKCKYLSTQQQIESLGLPIGWDDKTDPKRYFTGWSWAGDLGGWWDQLQWHWLGWLLTAFAISLGAPFWFDLLNKFIVIRSAVKPHEKSPEEESKD